MKFSKGDLVTLGIDNVSSTTVPVLDVGIILDTDVGTVTRSSVKLKVTACALSESKHRTANVAAIEENDRFKARTPLNSRIKKMLKQLMKAQPIVIFWTKAKFSRNP